MQAEESAAPAPFPTLLPVSRPPVPEGPYLILGIGEAGEAAARALTHRRGADSVLASDSRPDRVRRRVRRGLAELGVGIHLGPQEELLDASPPPRTIVKSPGIPADAPLLRRAAERGIEVIDELELGWRLGGAPMVAVTGTNGKTTTSTLAAAILAAGCARVRLAGNADTAPPLSAVGDDLDAVVCEVSSFQLEGCPTLLPEAAVFTNLSHDHLPRHGTMRRYAEVKRSLFVKGGGAVRLAVVDTIDDFGRELAESIERAGGRVVRVGVDGEADYRIREAEWNLRRATVELATPSGGLGLRTNLPGYYNARNVAAVVALAEALGMDRTVVQEVLAAHPGAEARFEHIDCGQSQEVILDTASSPVAVEELLAAVRAGMQPTAQLHVVVGVLGAPDPEQRHAIGRAARALSDRLIVAPGSFRPKPPLGTLEGIAAGARNAAGGELAIVPDRREAIAEAILGAAPGDVLCVLGRGKVVESIHKSRIDDGAALVALLRELGRGWRGPVGMREAAAL